MSTGVVYGTVPELAWVGLLAARRRALLASAFAGALIGLGFSLLVSGTVRATLFIDLPRLEDGTLVNPETYAQAIAPAASAAAAALGGRIGPEEFRAAYSIAAESAGISIRVSHPDRTVAVAVLHAIRDYVLKDLENSYGRGTASLRQYQAWLRDELARLPTPTAARGSGDGTQAPIARLADEANRFATLYMRQQLQAVDQSAAMTRPARTGAELISAPGAARRSVVFALAGAALGFFAAAGVLLVGAVLRTPQDRA